MSDIRSFYIKATGSTCYDKTGVTFPEHKQIDFTAFPVYFLWLKQFGWHNQPEVATFAGTYNDSYAVGAMLPHGLIVAPFWEQGS